MEKKYLKFNGKLFIIKPFEETEDNNIVDKVKQFYYIPEKVRKL